MFLPSPNSVCSLCRDINANLASSIQEIAAQVADFATIDTQQLSVMSDLIRTQTSIAPSIFLAYYDCLDAACRDDAEALVTLVGHLATLQVRAPGLRQRNFADHSLPPEEWDRYQRALLATPDTSIRLQGVPSGAFDVARGHLAHALRIIAGADPALAGEIASLTREIVFAQPRDGMDAFGGATSFRAWGVMFLNPHHYNTVVRLAEAVVHEAAHALLMARSKGQTMIENDPAERYPSPLRAGLRTMDGLFHATFVSARVCYAMDKILLAGGLPELEEAAAKNARDAASLAFDSGITVVAKHGRPTPAGRQAMEGAVAYMRAPGRHSPLHAA